MSAPSVPDRLPVLTSDQAFYLYGVACTGALPVDHVGLDDETPVLTGTLGTWTLVVDVVDRKDWTGETGEAHLSAIEWVAPRACRHEEVVESVMQHAPVFPARFGTLFSSEDELYRRLAAHDDALATYFDRVRDAAEWSVKGRLDRSEAEARLAESDDEDDASGTAYLQRRKREQQARRDVDAWLQSTADAMLDTLNAHAQDAVVLTPQPRPDADGESVLNWAFLVHDDRQAAFDEALTDLYTTHREYGLTLERSGPWPPYHFRPSIDDGASSHL